MKVFILYTLSLALSLSAMSQEVSKLPVGKYETEILNNGKWEKGDIQLIDATHYKISSSNEVGEYRFSAVAQRVFFTSGALKGAFARTALKSGSPSIVLPRNENDQLGLKLAHGDIVGVYRQ